MWRNWGLWRGVSWHGKKGDRSISLEVVWACIGQSTPCGVVYLCLHVSVCLAVCVRECHVSVRIAVVLLNDITLRLRVVWRSKKKGRKEGKKEGRKEEIRLEGRKQ